MKLVTLVVAPTYMAQITGVAGIQVSARKFKLMDAMLNPICECKRVATDDVNMNFLDLVALVKERAKSV